MVTVSHTAVAVSATEPLLADELAHACGAGLDWVVELVEVGIVEVEDRARPPQDWRFQSFALQCALQARRLERDFGVSLEAAALIIDLEREVRRLRRLLDAQGLRAR